MPSIHPTFGYCDHYPVPDVYVSKVERSAGRLKTWAVVALLATLVGFIGTTRADEDGETLFQQGRYAEAKAVLARQLARHPAEARLHFLMGRSCLAGNEAEEALPYLQKAVELENHSAEYHFWLGLAYWAQLDFEAEQASYRRALDLDPDHLPAHVYMGHNFMDRGLWRQALIHYERVLRDVPDHPEALFNSALAHRQLGRTAEENTSWKQYLGYYSTGRKAMTAVEHLNANGDFSFRPLVFGPRGVVLEQIHFTPGGTTPEPDSLAALDEAGRVVLQTPEVILQVVAYAEEAPEVAEVRAKFIKSYLLRQYPGIAPERIRISWFGMPETVPTLSGTVALNPSLRLFTEPAHP
jgi:tetratricopeptide (TPR) repeat protein